MLKFWFFLLTIGKAFSIISKPSRERDTPGSIAQLVEHMPYKHGVTGSSPVVPTICFLLFGLPGSVVQLVRTPACHAGGRGFKSLPSRHSLFFEKLFYILFKEKYASVAQLVEQGTENPRVVGSIPTGGTISPAEFFCGGTKCECSSSGRAPPCQGGGSEFEPRHSLHGRPPMYIGGLFSYLIFITYKPFLYK